MEPRTQRVGHAPYHPHLDRRLDGLRFRNAVLLCSYVGDSTDRDIDEGAKRMSLMWRPGIDEAIRTKVLESDRLAPIVQRAGLYLSLPSPIRRRSGILEPDALTAKFIGIFRKTWFRVPRRGRMRLLKFADTGRNSIIRLSTTGDERISRPRATLGRPSRDASSRLAYSQSG